MSAFRPGVFQSFTVAMRRGDALLSGRQVRSWLLLGALLLLGVCASSVSLAQRGEHAARGSARGGGSPAGSAVRGGAVGRTPPVRGQVFDGRYHHDYYYPQRGVVARTLPPGYRPYYFRGRPYYFFGGAWYAPGPLGFVVVAAPIGLVVPVLPPYYTTVWLGGVPYYYADDTYYQWVPDMNGYEVVAAPPDADQPGRPPQAAALGSQSNDLYIYPKDGQSSARQAADRYDCYQWAKSQTTFDPTQPNGGVPADQTASKSAQYNRAMTACLEARGYSVD